MTQPANEAPCDSLRASYSRAEMEFKLMEWMATEFGRPRDYNTEPEARQQWYRDFGMIYHFICDVFPE
jgi:hypothetical protein